MYRVLLILNFLLISLVQNVWAEGPVSILSYEGYGKNEINTLKFYLTKDSLRMDINLKKEKNGFTFLYKTQPNSFLVIDHRNKSYINVKEAIESYEKYEKMIQEQLAKIPPSQRKLAEEMLKSQLGAFLPKSKDELLDACEEPQIIGEEDINKIHTIVVDGCKYFTPEQGWIICRVWFADGENLGVSEEEFNLIISIMEEEKKILSKFRKEISNSIFYIPVDELGKKIKERVLNLPYPYPLPIKWATMKEDKEIGGMILKEVEKKDVSSLKELFSVPPDYKKISLENLKTTK